MEKRPMGFLALILLLAAFCLSGCGRGQRQAAGGGAEEGVYQIYYLDASGTVLTPNEYRTDTTDTDQLIGELMDQLRTVPQDLDSQSAIPDRLDYRGFHREEMVVYLSFGDSYNSMRDDQEILCRAALARTLTQAPEVNYISILAGEQPILDAKGQPVGMISGSDFVDSISDVNAYEKTMLTLYFTDEKGELLYPETREVVHNVNTSLAQLVIEELISGPETFQLCPTVPADTRLLNVSVNDNVCYVNFDETFLTGSGSLAVADYIPIYSIVNSLAEAAGISRVQFSINGSANVKFRDSISLDTQFERNLDYIGGE